MMEGFRHFLYFCREYKRKRQAGSESTGVSTKKYEPGWAGDWITSPAASALDTLLLLYYRCLPYIIHVIRCLSKCLTLVPGFNQILFLKSLFTVFSNLDECTK